MVVVNSFALVRWWWWDPWCCRDPSRLGRRDGRGVVRVLLFLLFSFRPRHFGRSPFSTLTSSFLPPSSLLGIHSPSSTFVHALARTNTHSQSLDKLWISWPSLQDFIRSQHQVDQVWICSSPCSSFFVPTLKHTGLVSGDDSNCACIHARSHRTDSYIICM